MTEWFAQNWNLVIGLAMTAAAAFVIPSAIFVHRLIEANVLRKAEAAAKALAAEHLKEYAKHRTEIVGKLEHLERGHLVLVRDVSEVKTLASALDAKADGHAEQLAFVKGALDAIKEGLNGYMKKEK